MNLFKKIPSLYYLILIILLGSVLRLWQLGNVPASPDWDEASLGYNAYSLLMTGKDEYGKTFPLILESFGDFKPALYSYLAIPSIALFGLNTFAVRLPSALLGILTLLVVYGICQNLFRRRDISLLTTFFLALSPWHIQFSRVAFETNVGLFFNVLGVFLFLTSLKKNILLPLSVLSFGLSMHTYQSEKVFVPLLGMILFILFYKEIVKIPKKVIVLSLFVGLIIISPIIMSLIGGGETLGRAKGVSIFSQVSEDYMKSWRLYEESKSEQDIIGMIFNSKYVFYAKKIISNYISHFDINWLFIHGDISRHHAPRMGLIYLFELPLICMGIYSLIFHKWRRNMKIFILLWILIAPAAASVTIDVPHAVRTLNFLPTYQILAALGSLTLLSFLVRYSNKSFYQRTLAKIGVSMFIITAVANISFYLNQYFVQMNYFYAKDWQYGYEEAVKYVSSVQNKYDKVIISDVTPLDQSYIFFLFYLKYSPHEYQREVKNSKEKDRKSFNQFVFRKIEWNNDRDESNILFMGTPADFSDGGKRVKTIKYPSGEDAIVFVES